jgi:modulator of FtsH protease HflC
MKKQAILIIAVIALIMVWSTAFIVDETQQVIITQFGKPVREAISTPGIHFKLPVIQEAHFFDKRYLEWDGSPNQVPTKDKRFIWIDTYARWRITDPLQFFRRLRDERGAQSRLDDILDGETRTTVASHDLGDLIRSSSREFTLDENQEKGDSDFSQSIGKGRKTISAEILKAASGRCADLGIEILDFQFKRINYVEEVRRKVYERMISERKRIADKYRSEGQGEAFKINGEKDRELKKIQSEAYRKSQEIVGKADAEATAIYAGAYNQNAQSKEFYGFIKTMETYLETFDTETALVLSTGGDFYKYLTKGK